MSEMRQVADNWRTNARLVDTWERGVRSRRWGRVYSRVVLGTTVERTRAHVVGSARLAAGQRVLDVPSGGGILLRALAANPPSEYVAADISPLMLARLRADATAQRWDFVSVQEADAAALPFSDGRFDVVLSYTGLHCMPAPRAALTELVRVLRPGGHLRGSLVVRTGRVTSTVFIEIWRLRRIFGTVVTADEFTSWLRAAASLTDVTVELEGSVLRFAARKVPA